MPSITLFGYSGHAYVVAETMELMGIDIIGYYDRKEAAHNPFDLNYLGDESDNFNLSPLSNPDVFYFIGIGDNILRKKIAFKLAPLGYKGAKVIHPSSIISRLASIESEVFVSAGVKVNALARIGTGTILNTGCIIEHECIIDSYTHIAPGAVLAGNVKVGEGSFVGANAVVRQGVTIGANVIIGAGAVVTKDVDDNVVMVGNPAQLLKLNI